MKDETIVITGAGSGIGRATALLCAQLGARIALLDREQEAVEDGAVQMCKNGAADALGLVCDVRQETEVEQAFASCQAKLGLPTGSWPAPELRSMLLPINCPGRSGIRY